ncbi:unnamed protein product [Brachionus calyciflorus]|uniref:NADH dehydrogenase [ubiquinone] 1 alpha subcomplex assembly factor 3 n=1 Tax=Brachionus calyciflorus TaxID=104777 RepID=A0A814HJV8_9BILA|nr:unnamed protein product [Brachionus calyciflorus]
MANRFLNPMKNLSKSLQFDSKILKSTSIPLNLSIRNESGFTDSSYTKTSIQKLTPDEGVSLQITSFNEFGFTLNQKIRILGPMIIFPKTIYSWNVADLDEVNEKSLLLFKLLEPKLDILVIGTGDKYSKIDPSVPKWLIENKINNFEILPTEKAINVFNFLLAENRFVGGAFLPSAITREVDLSVKRVFETASLYREIEEETKAEEVKRLKEKETKKIMDQ